MCKYFSFLLIHHRTLNCNNEQVGITAIWACSQYLDMYGTESSGDPGVHCHPSNISMSDIKMNIGRY